LTKQPEALAPQADTRDKSLAGDPLTPQVVSRCGDAPGRRGWIVALPRAVRGAGGRRSLHRAQEAHPQHRRPLLLTPTAEPSASLPHSFTLVRDERKRQRIAVMQLSRRPEMVIAHNVHLRRRILRLITLKHDPAVAP